MFKTENREPRTETIKCLFFLCAFVVLLSGCASLKETSKGILGISTKVLEEGRKDAVVKTFNLDYMSCKARVHKALKIIKAYIYEEDKPKNLIAIYVSETDTTPVGIFVTKVSPEMTKVEVSSPSSFSRDLIADKVFGYIEDKNSLKITVTDEQEKPLKVF
ncbi:MAG: hypothetical protein NTY47_00230 [Candidatus Omnitrophica bacterium]|nr:hypothetical protein [Candidatus Omnitrophota bacterium]